MSRKAEAFIEISALKIFSALLAELADASVLETDALRRGGSRPSWRTKFTRTDPFGASTNSSDGSVFEALTEVDEAVLLQGTSASKV